MTGEINVEREFAGIQLRADGGEVVVSMACLDSDYRQYPAEFALTRGEVVGLCDWLSDYLAVTV